MERISEILKKARAPINTSEENTDISSSAENNQPSGPVRPDCPICRGIGFIYARVPLGNPGFGKAIACRCLREKSDQEREVNLLRYSNLGALAGLTLAKINPEGRNGKPGAGGNFRAAFEVVRQYITDQAGWLVITGPSGSGKTCLAAAVANEFIRSGRPALYITAPDLLEKLRAGFNPDTEIPGESFFERVKNVPLLVLDDLGVQSGTPWAKEKLDQLINHRFTASLPTVVVTALPPEALDDRLRTRLQDADRCRVVSTGDKQTALEYGWGPEFQLQREMTFERFDVRGNKLSPIQQENLNYVFEAAAKFAEAPDGWLVMMGVNGCGKTHLAAAIANYRYLNNQPALFIVVPDFLDHLRSTFSPDSAVSYDDLFESVRKTPLLILDDFGEQAGTPWAQEKLYQVINYRYNSRMPTVITTSKALEEIEERISSRLSDLKISNLFAILATDYRSSRKPNEKKTAATRKLHYDR
jgi:DNA replication protein DnaC